MLEQEGKKMVQWRLLKIICTEANDYVSRASELFFVTVCWLCAWRRADLHKLSSTWWGNGRIRKTFLKMSVYELFLSFQNTVAGERFNSLFFFCSVEHCIQGGAL